MGTATGTRKLAFIWWNLMRFLTLYATSCSWRRYLYQLQSSLRMALKRSREEEEKKQNTAAEESVETQEQVPFMSGILRLLCFTNREIVSFVLAYLYTCVTAKPHYRAKNLRRRNRRKLNRKKSLLGSANPKIRRLRRQVRGRLSRPRKQNRVASRKSYP